MFYVSEQKIQFLLGACLCMFTTVLIKAASLEVFLCMFTKES